MNSVSVIVPVYNVEKYVDECITSVLHELQPQDELILINDGSRDNSLEICKKYEADNVIVINNENHGVSYTRNCGVEIAKGDYITFVDSDDYLYEGWREIVEYGMEQDTDIVYFGNTWDVPSQRELIMETLCIPSNFPFNLRASSCWYKLFKTNHIKKNNIKFDSELINGEDTMFCLDAILSGGSYSVQMSNNFYYYRPNNASATHTFNEKYNSSNLKFIRLVREKLLSSGAVYAEEAHKYIEFLDVNGLYILAVRISKIDDLELRKSKFKLFEQPEYIGLYKDYIPNELLPKYKLKVFKLLKKGKYEKAINVIINRAKFVSTVKKLLKKGRGE